MFAISRNKRKRVAKFDKKHSNFAYELEGSDLLIEEVGYVSKPPIKGREPTIMPFIRMKIDDKTVTAVGDRRTKDLLANIDSTTAKKIETRLRSADKTGTKKSVNTRTKLLRPIRLDFTYDKKWLYGTQYKMNDVWTVHEAARRGGVELEPKMSEEDALLVCNNLANLSSSRFFHDGNFARDTKSPPIDRKNPSDAVRIEDIGKVFCVEQGRKVPDKYRDFYPTRTIGKTDVLAGDYGEVGEFLTGVEKRADARTESTLIMSSGAKVRKVRGTEAEEEGVRYSPKDTSRFFVVPFVRLKMLDRSKGVEEREISGDVDLAEFEIRDVDPDRVVVMLDTMDYLIKATPRVTAYDTPVSKGDFDVISDELHAVKSPVFRSATGDPITDYRQVHSYATIDVNSRYKENKEKYGDRQIALVMALMDTADSDSLYRVHQTRGMSNPVVLPSSSKKGMPMGTPTGVAKALRKAAVRIAVRDKSGDILEI